MKIHFLIHFHSKPGQHLKISGSLPQLGAGDFTKSLMMNYLNDQFWQLQVEIPEEQLSGISRIDYRYIFSRENAEDIIEWTQDRSIRLSDIHVPEIQLVDYWNHAGEYENVFFTSPFREVLLKDRKPSTAVKIPKTASHIFKVKAPLLERDEVICILGNTPALGNWSISNPVFMEKEGDWWISAINLSKTDFPILYKYAVINKKTGKFVRFEAGENRIFYKPANKKRINIIHDGFCQLPNDTWKAAGVAIPVFSLRSQKSFGVGEFSDLKLLVDWAVKVGLKMIQLLPVNDTTSTYTWEDSYPYSAISAFALHPLYINLERVAGKEHAAVIKPFRNKQKQLNSLPQVDYETVLKTKLALLSSLYDLMYEKVFDSDDYKDFFKTNEFWLVPYAAFSYLRDKYNTADTTLWKQHKDFNAAAIQKLSSKTQKHFHKIAIHYFTQYQLHLQLKEAHDYANQHKIILKGDIPIGINRHGADAWTEPELYDMDVQAGAPPDDFAIKGQNWGFPTYNWHKMAEDGYLWWKKRFEQMSLYFDAFRIDHILGFFRIWSIPIHAVEGIMGHFVPAIPVHRNEFFERGIWFDHHRYCNPFINDGVLWELFGPNEKKFKPFLDQQPDNSYNLKPSFSTQKQVDDYFKTLESSDENFHIRQGLFDLISNVILFEDGGPLSGKFHFRFNIESTTAFRHLEWNTQQQLRELYIDYYFRRQDEFWRLEAMKKLPALKRATKMLICGEDLGLVPHCVPDVMKQLGILSLEIQRMPKNTGSQFFHPAHAPYLSVVTPSTHDMSTIRGWWEEDKEKIQRFYNEVLGQYGIAPSTCEAWINKEIVVQHLYSPAQWCVFQLQDILGMDEKLRGPNPHDERINIPAISKHYWRYRMNIFLEDLSNQNEFNDNMQRFVAASGRSNS